MALGALVVFQTIVSILQAVYLLKLRGKLAVSANARFMWHVLRLPVEFFSQRYAGDIAQRQQSNEMIAETLISQLGPLALNLGVMAFYFCLMIRYSPPVSYTHLRAHETGRNLVCRLLLEKKKK